MSFDCYLIGQDLFWETKIIFENANDSISKKTTVFSIWKERKIFFTPNRQSNCTEHLVFPMHMYIHGHFWYSWADHNCCWELWTFELCITHRIIFHFSWSGKVSNKVKNKRQNMKSDYLSWFSPQLWLLIFSFCLVH